MHTKDDMIDLFLDLINYDGNAGAVETDIEITKHHCYERRHGFRSELSSNHFFLFSRAANLT
jgi:hypothetical protein